MAPTSKNLARQGGLSWCEAQLIRLIRDAGELDNRALSEPSRQAVIAAGMREPALVDIDGDRLYLTAAGQAVARELR